MLHSGGSAGLRAPAAPTSRSWSMPSMIPGCLR
jgi:hypothetical protein